MASIYGDDGGTIVRGRRRPTNAGYPPVTPGFTAPDRATDRGRVPDDPFTPTHGGPGPTGGPSGGYDPNAGSTPPVQEPPVNVPAPPKPRTYAQIAGLDLGKLQNEGYKSYKYGDAARAFSSFVGGGGHVGRNALDDLVKYAQDQFGLKSAHAVGDDKVDFGEGSGAIDLLLGGNDGLWWGQEDPFTAAAGGGAFPVSGGESPFPGLPPGTVASTDMSWLADLLKAFAPQPAAAPTPAAAPPVVVNVPGQQPSYSQPSPTFGGGYVQSGFAPSGDGQMDATSLLSMALPELLKDPNALNNPLVRQILGLVQGGR